MVGVYDWLSKQKYSFGIAEFNFNVGPFAVFEALGIENTFNVFATPFFPGYLQYLGIDVTLYNIPGILLVTNGMKIRLIELICIRFNEAILTIS
ncbi:unnamed protein product [Meloidogyne enterolobii]|uniref:Uncharacterized protein n=1 Tax=Meloidogyne enterolobii TaxID=390850 RepID=A0ACB0ZW89_MELEN